MKLDAKSFVMFDLIRRDGADDDAIRRWRIQVESCQVAGKVEARFNLTRAK